MMHRDTIELPQEKYMPQTPTRPDHGSPPGAPRWVKVLGIMFIVLVVIVVALHLTGIVQWGHMP